MSRIVTVSIQNFRTLKKLRADDLPALVCLIGAGDSGKTTFLEAISLVLSSNWNVPFYDNDFYNCETSNPILIEATLIYIPAELLNESRFGLYLRGYHLKSGMVTDDPDEGDEIALTIQLMVAKDLEPAWSVITNREIGSKPIGAADRSRLNAFLISDYVDKHFSWGKGNPLYSLLKQELKIENDDEDILIDILREAKGKIDGSQFGKFDRVVSKVKLSAANFGVDISKTVTTMDFKDIVMKDGKLTLHDETIPFRLKGKGTKRLISMTIQALIAGNGGIVLIDEIEQGLESYRVQHLVNLLKKDNKGQVFLTTHSRDVIVELDATDLFLIKRNNEKIIHIPGVLQAAVRANPESMIAKKVIVCEGPTEIGFVMALNEFRILNQKKNLAYLGVRSANGNGTTMFDYVKAFSQSQISACLFCDFDAKDDKAMKELKEKFQQLVKLEIPVISWNENDCIELAVFREVPFEAVIEMVVLYAKLCAEEFNISFTEASERIAKSVGAQYGNPVDVEFSKLLDTPDLRKALGIIASKRNWFKRQTKGYAWGQIIFKYYQQLPLGSLTRNITQLSDWIDQP